MGMGNVLILAVAMVLAAASPQTNKKDAPKGDQGKLQGVWKLVRCEAEGKVVDNRKCKKGSISAGLPLTVTT